jgi:hypothetical protein
MNEYFVLIGGREAILKAEELENKFETARGMGLPFLNPNVDHKRQDVYFIQLYANDLQEALAHPARKKCLDEFVTVYQGKSFIVTAVPTDRLDNEYLESLKDDPLCEKIHKITGFYEQPNTKYRADGLVVVTEAASSEEAIKKIQKDVTECNKIVALERQEI